jgi:hypothetical protein
MEGQYGDLSVFPKELKFIVLALLDAKSLGRVMQLNRAYSTLPSDLNIWKHFCLTQWNLPLDKLKKLDSIASNINWKREYRVMTYFSNRIFNNQLVIRSEDDEFVKSIDEDPNSLHYHASSGPEAESIAVQTKFKLYPLPLVNFMVSYYELTIEHFGPDEHVVGIGLALPKYKRAMPGWGKDSYGLHADDGGFFNQRPFGITFCEPWSCGDTLGLGINYATKQLFITRNGTLMGTLGKKLRNLMHLHPTVGINKVDNKCRVNFGQKPFEFDLVSYLNQLDTDEKIAARWPQKLYSQVIQEFEEMLIDDEDPDDVEAELMGAHDYYEHDEEEEGQTPEQGPLDFTQAPEDMNDELKLQHMGVIIEELFSISELLGNEETQEAVAQNRPEIKKLFTSLVTDLQLPINPEGPLTEVHMQLTDSVFSILGAYYSEYLRQEKALNKAKAAKKSDVKLHTTEESRRLHDINLALLMSDQSFPDNHPLVVYCASFLSRNFQIPMPDPDHPTADDRAVLGLRHAAALFFRNRSTQNDQHRETRRKMSEKVREKKRKDFRDIFGEDAFYNKAEQTLQAGSILTKKMTDEEKKDMSAAEDYCNTYMFGSSLLESEEDLQLWRYLSWWYFAAEEPLDPNLPAEKYVKQCLKACKTRLKYWEEDYARFKSVIRGSLLILSDPDLDLESHQFVTLLRAWRIVWIYTEKPLKPPTLAEVRGRLVRGLETIYNGSEEMYKEFLVAVEEVRKDDLEVEGNEDEEDEEEDAGAKTQSTTGATWILPAIAAATAVAVIGAVFYFRNNWRKQ